MISLISLCFIGFLGSIECQVLSFDVTRSTYSSVPQTICAKLVCNIFPNAAEAMLIDSAISLTILEETEPGKSNRLADISTVDSGVNIYGDTSFITGRGFIATRSGELFIEINGIVGACSSTTYSCELQFRSSSGKQESIKVKKGPSASVPISSQQQKYNPVNSEAIVELRTLIFNEVSKIDKKYQNMDAYLGDVVEELHTKLGKVEYILEEYQSRMRPVDEKLDHLEELVQVEFRFKQEILWNKLNNVSDTISGITTAIKESQNNSNILEASLSNVSLAVESLCLNTSTQFSVIDNRLAILQNNMSTSFSTEMLQLKTELREEINMVESVQNTSDTVQVLNIQSDFEKRLQKLETQLYESLDLRITRFQEEITKKLEALKQQQPNPDNISDKINKRILQIVNQLVKLTFSLTDFKDRLYSLVTNLQAVQYNLTTLSVYFKHQQNRFDLHLTEHVSDFTQKLEEFASLAKENGIQESNSRPTDTSAQFSGNNFFNIKDSKIHDRLAKLDMSLHDVNIVIKNLKFFFR